MKSLPTFISACVLIGVLAVAFPLARMRGHWLVMVYLSAQFLFTIAGLLCMQKFSLESPNYRKLFAVAALLAIGAAWTLAFYWVKDLGFALVLLAILCSALVPIGAAAVVSSSATDSEAPLYIVLAALFLFPGMLALYTLSLPSTPVDTMVRITFGAFWIITGIYGFGMAASLSNRNLAVLNDDNWIATPVIAAICFGLLIFGLGKAQREVGQQAIHADVQTAMAQQ